jgi:ADP-ribosyl-[dinitrogen reductase] hydrolase
LSAKWNTVEKSSRKPQSRETPEQVSWVKTWSRRRRSVQQLSLRERYRGALLGLAAGDALGTTVEFQAPGTFKPITDIVGGGPFGLEPGQWTDDTSMALCLAESLIEKRGFDPKDQMDRYCRWWKEGYLSSTGTCFDIGIIVRTALASYLRSGEPFAGLTDPFSAGNGSLMRLAPVVLAYRRNFDLAIHNAGESSRTTHAGQTTVDACRYFAGLLLGALEGRSKRELLSSFFCPAADRAYWKITVSRPKLPRLLTVRLSRRNPPRSSDPALWCARLRLSSGHFIVPTHFVKERCEP